MLLMVSSQNYNELLHSRSAVPVDTIHLHSVIELDRTVVSTVTYLAMYSTVGQRPQVNLQYSADVRCLVPNSSTQPVIQSTVFMV